MLSELVAELGAGDAFPRDDENRVLAGDRAEDVRVPRLVHRLGEGAGIARRRLDDEEVVARVDGERPAAQREGELAMSVGVRGARRRVDEAAARRAHLDEAELGDVAGDGGLDDFVAGVPKRLGELGLGRDGPLADEAEDDALALPPVHRSTSVRIASAWSTSAGPTTRGGVSRSTRSPAEPTTRPASRQAATAGPAGRSSSQPSRRPRPRTSVTAGSAARPEESRAPISRTLARSSSSRASRTAQAAAQATGLPPKGEAWSPGEKAPAASSRTSSAPIGRPFARPFASATTSGLIPSCSWAKKVPVRPSPHCTSSKTRSAPLPRASSAADSRNRSVAGLMPPSPWIGSSRTQPTFPSAAAAASDSAAFRRAERTSGTSGPNPFHFAGGGGTEGAPKVRPWNEVSSATIPGF